MGYMKNCERKVINIPKEDLEMFEMVSRGETLSESVRKAFKLYLEDLRKESRNRGAKA